MNSPFPMVIFRPENGEVIWSNDRFLSISGEREHLFDTHITAAVPDFSSNWLMEGRTECPTEYTIRGRRYCVFGHLINTGKEGKERLIATTYWLDVTELTDIRDKYYATRPVVSILTIDNYEELIRNATDNRRTQVRSGIEREISQWIAPAHGLLCRYDRDRYLFIFEEQYLAAYRQNKFALLEAVQKVTGPHGISATLSIGIGVGASFHEMFQFAIMALEMALSRGGDRRSSRAPRSLSSTAAAPKRPSAGPRSRAGSPPALWPSWSPPPPRSLSWATDTRTWTRWAPRQVSAPSPGPRESPPLSCGRAPPPREVS